MKKITLIFLLTYSTFCFSQNFIEGYIIDKTTNESLPYATIKLISNVPNYTITNGDGKFEINSKLSTDSLEVRFLGFQTKKVPISFFEKNIKFYLSPNINTLNTVLVVAKTDKNYTYNLLNSLIQKYREKKTRTKNKGFLVLTSSVKNIPIEIVEGFYNNEQNLSKGIINLDVKNGRFGQNTSFPFYSLNNTDILKDFQLFKRSSQILPLYPGNMTLSSIKGKYIVKINDCSFCSSQDLSISFIPKKNNGRLFMGKIIFNKETLTIKKIELRITDPETKGLTSIIQKDIITPKDIKLDINFNPNDYEKIQTINFEFVMYYKSEENFEIINSHTFLYLYDYNKPFEDPYFTNNINFNNDYDKIIALQASDKFWDSNYQFPKSFVDKKSINFLKKYGYLINYQNKIPSSYIEYLNPSVISWNKDQKINWESIKLDVLKEKKVKDHKHHQEGHTIVADGTSDSPTELKKRKNSLRYDKKFNFSYLLDEYYDRNGNRHFITRTLFNRNSSFYSNSRSKNRLDYLNLIFDIYEIFKRQLDAEITTEMSFEDAKILCDKKFNEASITVLKMEKQTNSGSNYQNLAKWNKSIKGKLTTQN